MAGSYGDSPSPNLLQLNLDDSSESEHQNLVDNEQDEKDAQGDQVMLDDDQRQEVIDIDEMED